MSETDHGITPPARVSLLHGVERVKLQSTICGVPCFPRESAHEHRVRHPWDGKVTVGAPTIVLACSCVSSSGWPGMVGPPSTATPPAAADKPMVRPARRPLPPASWYLVCRPARPSPPVELEQLITTVTPVTDITLVGRELTELRELEGELDLRESPRRGLRARDGAARTAAARGGQGRGQGRGAVRRAPGATTSPARTTAGGLPRPLGRAAGLLRRPRREGGRGAVGQLGSSRRPARAPCREGHQTPPKAHGRR